MLVLVSTLRIVLTVILSVALCHPVFAQDTSSRLQSGGQQKSILVSAGGTNPALTSGANGSASIDSPIKGFSGNATFTARPQERSSASTMTFGDAPQPPSQMLSPEGPTEDTFTRPKTQSFVNDLRSNPSTAGNETSTQSQSQNASSGGGDARGTYATTQQSWQDQTMSSPSNRSFQTPNVEQFKMPAQPNASMMTNQQPSQINGQSSRSPFGAGASLGGTSQRMQPSQAARSPQSMLSSSIQPIQNPSSRMATNQNNSVRLANGQQSGLGGIQPTGFTQPVPKKKLTTTLAKSLMQRYSVDNVSGSLPGEPIKLVDMFRQPIDSTKRQPMVHHYWEAYYDWATYVNTQRYSDWLAQAPNVQSRSERGLLDAAKIAASNRVMASDIQLGKSQARMLQYMPNRVSQTLPLPENGPLIQKYKTNYDAYKSYRMLPESLRGIDQMLPKTLRLIATRAEAVEVSKAAADQMLAGLQNGQSNVASALEAGRIWRRAEQDLIATVINYNQAIADYALNIAQGSYSPERTVEMLIGKPKPKTQALQASSRNGSQQQGSQLSSQAQPRVANAAVVGGNRQGQGGSQYGRQSNQRQPANGNFGPRGQQQNNTNFGRPQGNSTSFGPPATQVPNTAPNSGLPGSSNFGAPPSGGGQSQFGPPIGGGR